MLILLVSALCTYATIIFSVPPNGWHLLWMVVFSALLGIPANRGADRLVMALVLPFASLMATTVVGNAMGGI